MAAMLVRGLVWTNATFGVSDSYLLPLLKRFWSDNPVNPVILSKEEHRHDDGIQKKRGQDNGIKG